MKIGAIVQARYFSTRLPGKVLRDLPFASGITVLEQVIRRLKKSGKLNDIIVATTLGKDCDKIAEIAKKEKVSYFRGDENNVLSRYYLTAVQNKIDVIVRITSDCPCVDFKIVDLIIERHLEKKCDYTSNTIKRSYPRGFDVEVFNFSALETAYRNAKEPHQREHVTPYIYENADTFKVAQVNTPPEFCAPELRITLDTEEDYALLCVIYDCLYSKNVYFALREVLSLFKNKPWLELINKKVPQKRIK